MVWCMPNRHRTLHLVFTSVLLASAPALLSAQEAAPAVTCKDGTTSKGGKGACSHGGVAQGTTAAPTAVKNGPLPEAAQTGARVRCSDGSSAPHGGRGACSGHGGIDKNAANDNSGAAPVTKQATAVTPAAGTPHSEPMNTPDAALPGKATAKCKDGSLSSSKHRSGTCSRHGGVAQWMDGSN
jgi:Protein of unknown function (DUF3761)